MKLKIDEIVRNVKTTMSEHSPEILMGIGIAGMVTTAVLAVRATPKALKLLDEAAYERDPVLHQEELPMVDKVKVTWKCYAPAVATGVFSIACLIGSNSVNARRNAALATAYKLSETALTEYREKVIETVGEKKNEQIKGQLDKDRIEKNPVSTREVIITDKGEALCYDSISGRYFKSSRTVIDKAVNKAYKQTLDDMYISLNEFYDELDLSHIDVGYDLGWNSDKPIEISYSTQIADDGSTPCLVINYDVTPKYNFDRLAY